MLLKGHIIHMMTDLGTVHNVSIRNMDEQHQDFLEMQKTRTPVSGIGILAVTAGDGLAEVFSSLGVAGIVEGGQTMNPSTKDLRLFCWFRLALIGCFWGFDC